MAEKQEAYRVLARKYRPQNFDELVGQDALVRTLKNAIEMGRIAHAFMLTGVRGVGKTTTARIIAKSLNYTGPDGKSGPTTGSTDDCTLCQAISEDRHPDVIEMDAASRTGVDDIREILDGVRYAPTEARYKIYVIDEVHMLSKNAFNALLKTLEEPPEHVKFIFATTEIRKVPVTVLSRCQRFDLKRVGVDLLQDHFQSICKSEKVKAEDEAISMIARAADGSVRDGLSLLDQAMALAGKKITGELVRDMLGLSDRAQNIDLLENALSGDMPGALQIMDGIYQNGGMPLALLQDLLELTHLLIRMRAAPKATGFSTSLSPDQLDRLGVLATKISMPSLGKAWQLLLKGIGEVNEAPNPQAAAEIVIISLAYAANLPDPADLVKKLKDSKPLTGGNSAPPQGGSIPVGGGGMVTASGQVTKPQEMAYVESQPQMVLNPENVPTLKTLEDMIALLKAHQEFLLAEQLRYVRPAKLEHINHGEKIHGRFEFCPEEGAMPKLAQDLGTTLKKITNQRWMVSIVPENGTTPTLFALSEAKRLQELEDVAKMPLVHNILQMFPDSTLVKVHHKKETQEQEDKD
ncbi:MAG: DNA polymerase III subunit gamma/tau [Alphaproteobacteria bacterium]|nr:DNA polymerase III subunit gamma/tau [Alphaproteobacteria bacterium]